MEYKDYYAVLGVDKSVGKDELKKKYRTLARKYHPDINTGDKNAGVKFGEISEAYNVLIDSEKRQKYDAFGADWERHQKTGDADNFDWTKYTSGRNGSTAEPTRKWEDLFGSGVDASEFFRTIFGQGFQGGEGTHFPRNGQDLQAELAISLEDAYQGGTRILDSGDKKIRIKLKPGIWDRQKIQIHGKGTPGRNGGINGDLYITFLIRSHPEYRLEGTDLFKDLPLDVYSAMLGTTVKARTISGLFELTIPPMTRNGMVFRLKGRGFPAYDNPGKQGDLYLKISLQLPEKPTPEELQLIRQLDEMRKRRVAGVLP